MNGGGSRVVVALAIAATLVAVSCKKTTAKTAKVHRAVATACPAERPNVPEPQVPPRSKPQCQTHADCTEGKNGRCIVSGRHGLSCTYDACFSDSDCSAGALCECRSESGAPTHHCVMSRNCRVDSDCAGKGSCSPSLGSCGHYSGIEGYYCHTPADECTDDEECEKTSKRGEIGTCRFVESVGHWKCSTAECEG